MRFSLFLSLSLSLALVASCTKSTPDTPQDPGLVQLTADLGNEFVPAGELSDIVARVRITAADLEAQTRRPLNIGLVIDTSGSMRGQPMRDARDASLELVNSLREGDRLAVIAFHSRAEVLLPSTEIDTEVVSEIREKITAMEASGTTDLQNGLALALQQITPHNQVEEVTSRIVLLSDGVPNVKDQIQNLAVQSGQRQIPISALGLGLEYDEVLMGEIAQNSGGSFHYVQDSAEVMTAFRDEVLRLERLVARGTRLRLQGGPGVEIIDVVGQPQNAGNAAVELTLGDLAEGESRDIVVRLRAPGRREGATVEVLDAVLTFQDATSDQAQSWERTAFLGAAATMSDEQIAQGRNDEVMQAAENAAAAAATVQAIRVIRQGNYAQAALLLDEAERSYGAAGSSDAAASVRNLRRAISTDDDGTNYADDESDRPASAPAPSNYEPELRGAHDMSLETMGY